MARLRAALPKWAANSNRAQYQDNPDVTFATRLYTPFDITIKNIRLTCTLKTVANTTEIYLSTTSLPAVVRCFNCLYGLRRYVK